MDVCPGCGRCRQCGQPTPQPIVWPLVPAPWYPGDIVPVTPTLPPLYPTQPITVTC